MKDWIQIPSASGQTNREKEENTMSQFKGVNGFSKLCSPELLQEAEV